MGDASLYDLKATHKHRILRSLFQSKHFEHDTKMEMMELVFGDDKSDTADRIKAECIASLPDAAGKAKIWAEITDPNNKDSAYIRRAKMSGFYGNDQLDIIQPYFDKFYETLPVAFKTMQYRNFEAFFHSMLPKHYEIKDEHIVRLVCLKQDTHDTDKVFMNTLQDGIELLIRIKEIRALNNK